MIAIKTQGNLISVSVMGEFTLADYKDFEQEVEHDIQFQGGVNLLLEGPDNFVCKLYPITVREIGPGWVMGEERLTTTVSGTYRWPGRATKLRLYRYNAEGELQRPVPVVEAGPEFRAEVPERGLLIAEVAGP